MVGGRSLPGSKDYKQSGILGVSFPSLSLDKKFSAVAGPPTAIATMLIRAIALRRLNGPAMYPSINSPADAYLKPRFIMF